MRSSDYKYAMVYQVDHKKETKITQLAADKNYRTQTFETNQIFYCLYL